MAAGPPATIAAWTGTPQSAAPNTNFGVAMVAVVRDSGGNGSQGATVTFTAPASGASGTFGSATTASVVTDNNGLAIAPTFRANAVGGSYNVTASVPGVATSAAFAMTNTGSGGGSPTVPGAPTNLRIVSSVAGAPSSVVASAGTPQSATVSTNFGSALQATVRDSSSNPVGGVTVTFTAPASGATARFGSSATATAVTDAGGVATAPTLTANATVGSYTVSGSVSGVAGTAAFNLTNGSGVPPPPPLGGTWTNVTPAGINLDPNGTAAGPTNNYGVQGVTADPAHPGTLYAPVTYQGLWKSTDYGQTWFKVVVTSGQSPMDNGRGNLQIAPDGSYMIAAALYPINGVINGSWKSLNGGQTWTRYNTGITGEDIQNFAINPNDKTRVIASPHTGPYNLFESRDSGQTFTNLGPVGSTSFGHFLWIDDNTLLAISDGDNGPGQGTWRGVRSSSTWPWTWSWSKVSSQQHWHGSSQMYIDPTTGAIFTGGGYGIQKSSDRGLTWTTVSNANSAGIVGTATMLYATSNYANNGAGFGPNLMHSSRASGGTSWATDTPPAAMKNGWIHAAAVFDGTHWIVISGNWNAGIWRLVEQ
jgi:hypothetical protein